VHRVRIEHERDAVILTAEGELDAYAAPALSEALEDVGADGLGRFVADLSNVSFMDSTALGLLVRMVKDIVERGGHARVVLPATMARRIFEITTLDRVLPVSRSRADALSELETVAGDASPGEPA